MAEGHQRLSGTMGAPLVSPQQPLIHPRSGAATDTTQAASQAISESPREEYSKPWYLLFVSFISDLSRLVRHPARWPNLTARNLV